MSNSAAPFSKDRPYPARVIENRLLTKPGSAKETRHLVVDLAGSGLAYKPGDSLGVYPSNRDEEVDEILGLLGAGGHEQVTLPRATMPVSLRHALSTELSLAGPTRKVIELFASKATDAREKATLQGLLAPEAKDALTAFLRERQFVDLLVEFPSTRLGPQAFIDLLRKLSPRLYSIASSLRAFPNEAHLTVAIVRYRTNNRDRAGVCSTFLADRVRIGETPAPVFVSESHFGLPEDSSRDCIMVGPGTGIAPFRAFLQERETTGAKGRNWLFFGDQHRKTDFLYEEEWERYRESGLLQRLDVAFSRDQANKIYVQDRMRENAAELWAWLQAGACFFVCGDAKRMAKDVDVALLEIVGKQGGLSPEAAAAYVTALKKDKRYQRDVY